MTFCLVVNKTSYTSSTPFHLQAVGARNKQTNKTLSVIQLKLPSGGGMCLFQVHSVIVTDPALKCRFSGSFSRITFSYSRTLRCVDQFQTKEHDCLNTLRYLRKGFSLLTCFSLIAQSLDPLKMRQVICPDLCLLMPRKRRVGFWSLPGPVISSQVGSSGWFLSGAPKTRRLNCPNLSSLL